MTSIQGERKIIERKVDPDLIKRGPKVEAWEHEGIYFEVGDRIRILQPFDTESRPESRITLQPHMNDLIIRSIYPRPADGQPYFTINRCMYRWDKNNCIGFRQMKSTHMEVYRNTPRQVFKVGDILRVVQEFKTNTKQRHPLFVNDLLQVKRIDEDGDLSTNKVYNPWPKNNWVKSYNFANVELFQAAPTESTTAVDNQTQNIDTMTNNYPDHNNHMQQKQNQKKKTMMQTIPEEVNNNNELLLRFTSTDDISNLLFRHTKEDALRRQTLRFTEDEESNNLVKFKERFSSLFADENDFSFRASDVNINEVARGSIMSKVHAIREYDSMDYLFR